MPTITDPNVVRAIAREYVANGHNKPQALIAAGYKPSYANSGKGTGLYQKQAVKDAIAAYEADMRVDSAMTVERVQQMYLDAIDLAVKNNQPSAAVSGITGIARLYGMDKQTTVSEHTPDQPEGKEAEVLDKLSKQYKIKLSGTG
jgi:hypothetical protein